MRTLSELIFLASGGVALESLFRGGRLKGLVAVVCLLLILISSWKSIYHDFIAELADNPFSTLCTITAIVLFAFLTASQADRLSSGSGGTSISQAELSAPKGAREASGVNVAASERTSPIEAQEEGDSFNIFILVLLGLLLSGGAVIVLSNRGNIDSATQVLSPVSESMQQEARGDIFGYCKRVVNQDAIFAQPGEAGENLPKVIVDAIGSDGLSIRCMNGFVYACYNGASGRACGRANGSKSPSQRIAQFCKEEPNYDSLPMSIIDNSSSTWSCRNGMPVILETFPLDERKFFKGGWRKIGQ